jgi:hypothetical protein
MYRRYQNRANGRARHVALSLLIRCTLPARAIRRKRLVRLLAASTPDQRNDGTAQAAVPSMAFSSR